MTYNEQSNSNRMCPLLKGPRGSNGNICTRNRYYRVYTLLYSVLSSLKAASSVSKIRVTFPAFHLTATLYEPIKIKHKAVNGTLIAMYSHQLWLIMKVAWPSVPCDVLKKPMPKMLLTREAGRKSMDRIWMTRSARLS